MQRLYLNVLKEHIPDTEMVVDIELLPQQPLTVVEAVIREVKEETGLVFMPLSLISVHHLFLNSSSFFRFNSKFDFEIITD